MLSVAAGGANTAVGLVLGLVTPPILLDYLGDDRVGTIRVAQEWLGYLALLDLGLGGAVQVALAGRFAAGDTAGAAAVARGGMRTYARLAWLALAAVLAAVALAPYMVRGLPDDLVFELRWGVAVCVVTAATMPLNVFRAVAEASQRGYVVHAALIAQSIVTAAASIAAAFVGAGIPGQFLASSAGLCVMFGVLARDTSRRLPGLGTASAAATPVAGVGSMFVYTLTARIGLLSDCIIVGQVLGAAAVVRFALTQRVLYLAQSQAMSLGNATWAALTELYKLGEVERFRDRIVQLTRLTALLAAGLLGPVAVWNRPLVSAWVGEDRYGGDLLTVVTAASLYLHALFALWSWPVVGTGRVSVMIPFMIVGTGANVAVSIAGAYWWGLVGPALGSLLFWSIANPGVLRVLRREMDVSVKSLLAAASGPALAVLGYSAGLYVLAETVPVTIREWPRGYRFIAFAGITAVAASTFVGVGSRLLLPAADRAFLRGLFVRRPRVA